MEESTAGTLFGLPTYFVVIAVIAFIVVVAGMTVYTVVMNRIEADSEDDGRPPPHSFPAPAQGNAFVAPPPEPLHAWVVMCAAFMDNGASWLSMPIADARDMLGNGWGIDSPASLEETLKGLSQSELNAWNMVRLFRVGLAGVRAGYMRSEYVFAGIRPVAQRLQAAFPGFEAIWSDYLAGLRRFKSLPPDGSGDDAELAHYTNTMTHIRAANFNGVHYQAPL